MARIKGFAIRGLLKYVKTSGHPGGIPAVLDELSTASRADFTGKIRHGAWYPYATYAELLRVVDRSLGDGDLSLCVELGRFAARQDAGSLFKFVAFFTSVKTLLERSSLFWGRYCDTGVFETTDLRDGAGTGVLREFPDVAPEHCHLLRGWVEGMALEAGASSVTVEKTRCVHRGDSLCEYRGSWEGD